MRSAKWKFSEKNKVCIGQLREGEETGTVNFLELKIAQYDKFGCQIVSGRNFLRKS